MRNAGIGFGAALLGACWAVGTSAGRAEAQAVAFQPVVGSLPDGVGLNVVPTVSADRRYVRVSVDAGFQAVNGFQAIGVPFAVSGLGGGGGGGATGLRSVGVAMGMDGPVARGMGATPSGPTGPGAADGYAIPGPGYYDNEGAWGDGSWSPAPRRGRAARGKASAASSRARKPAPARPATPPAAAATPAATPAANPGPSPRR